MLSRTSVEQGLLLATALDQAFNGKPMSLVPVEGSPLAALVRITGATDPGDDYAKYLTRMVAEAVTTDDKIDSTRTLIDGILYHTNSEDPVTKLVPHDTVQEELVELHAPVVAQQLAHARNVVKPMIERLMTMVTTELNGRVNSALLAANVIEVRTPVVFNDPGMIRALEKYTTLNYNPDMVCSFALPVMSDEALRDLIKTGSPETDAAIDAWLSTEGEGWLTRLYTDFFTAATSIRDTQNLHGFLRYTAKNVVYARNLPNVDICRVIGLFILADALYDNPIEGTAVKLEDYNRYMSDLRDSLGALLVNERAEYYRMINDERQLVIRVEDNTTLVREELYEQFLAEGGDVEMLYGNGLRTKPYSSIDELRAHSDELRSEWHRHVAIARQVEERNIETITRNIFRRAVIDVIASLDEDLKKHTEHISRIWEQTLENTSNKDLRDICMVSTRLICRAVFPHTDAEIIIGLTNEVASKNPDMSIRDVVLVATINYVCAWGRKQLKLVQQ